MRRFLFLVSFLFLFHFIFAEDTENEYAYGTVVKISDTEIVLKEYNFEKEEFVDINYKLSADVKVRNAPSVKDLASGNQVEILYAEKDGVKNALVVVLEKNDGIAEGPTADDEEDVISPPSTDSVPTTDANTSTEVNTSTTTGTASSNDTNTKQSDTDTTTTPTETTQKDQAVVNTTTTTATTATSDSTSTTNNVSSTPEK